MNRVESLSIGFAFGTREKDSMKPPNIIVRL